MQPMSTIPGIESGESADRKAATTESTGNGQVGQRQTSKDIAPSIAPMARINSRVHSRVENRLNTRVDRNYSPAATASSTLQAAEDRARTSGQARPR